MPGKLFALSQKAEYLLFGMGELGLFCLCVVFKSTGMEVSYSTAAPGLLLTTGPTKHGLRQQKRSSETVHS